MTLRVLGALALGLVLVVFPVAAGCSGSPDDGNHATIQGEQVGAGSHMEMEHDDGSARMHDHGSGHYHH